MSAGVETRVAGPFVKWVGGKRHLVPRILEVLAGLPAPRVYREPFVGGGALFFALRKRWGRGPVYILGDRNAELVEAYWMVRAYPGKVVNRLREMAKLHCADYYYQVRAQRPEDLELVERAARLIYLNKTCFNGMYRVNSKGRFNVPIGRYEKPVICDEVGISLASDALQGTFVANEDALGATWLVEKGVFLYLDPPYAPVSETANFVAYGAEGFGEAEQRALAAKCREWSDAGARFLLSNSDVPLTRELYRDFTVESVTRPGSVSCKRAGRGKVGEILVRNF